MIYFYCIVLFFQVVLAESDKCEALPADCQPGHDPPSSGGPRCTCTATQQPQCCILKPCELVNDDSLCDCTRSTGCIKNRQFCRKYQCTSESGHRQYCSDLPFDCTMKSLNTTPANGGPECSCTNHFTPAGCTLKTCNQGKLISGPCVSKPDGMSSACLYGSVCPGNWNSTECKSSGNDCRARFLSWVVGIGGGALVTFAIMYLRAGTSVETNGIVNVDMSILVCCLGQIWLIIGMVWLGLGVWFVFKK